MHAIVIHSLIGSGNLIRQCRMEEFGVLMPREPKIMSMDWRSLGYWPVWKDGKKVWVPKEQVDEQ